MWTAAEWGRCAQYTAADGSERVYRRDLLRRSVNYPADSRQGFGVGADDLARHLTAVAATCPKTTFVLGGYSQGAMVIAAAIGVPMSGARTDVLPASLGTQVAAVVVFGNPLGFRGRSIDTVDTPFRARSVEFCDRDGSVCGRRGPFPGSHRGYPDNGATDQAAAFAIGHLPP